MAPRADRKRDVLTQRVGVEANLFQELCGRPVQLRPHGDGTRRAAPGSTCMSDSLSSPGRLNDSGSVLASHLRSRLPHAQAGGQTVWRETTQPEHGTQRESGTSAQHGDA